MSRLKDKYIKEILPKLKKEFGIKNDLAAPGVLKVVVNVGLGAAKSNPELLEKLKDNLSALSGQKPLVTRAKQAVSGFKLSKGDPIGGAVTMRGKRMYHFLDKLFNIVLPRVRDFRGIPHGGFDNHGNFTLGLKEQAIFPEVGFQGGPLSGKMPGLEISIVTTAENSEKGKRLLELLGMPFKKEGK